MVLVIQDTKENDTMHNVMKLKRALAEQANKSRKNRVFALNHPNYEEVQFEGSAGDYDTMGVYELRLIGTLQKRQSGGGGKFVARPQHTSQHTSQQHTSQHTYPTTELTQAACRPFP